MQNEFQNSIIQICTGVGIDIVRKNEFSSTVTSALKVLTSSFENM